MKQLRNEKGFTLIEIIAVLIILGILSAVALPKYMDMQDEARIKAAQAGIAEAKARLSNGYAKALLKKNGANVTVAEAMGNANVEPTSYGDYNVGITNADPFATITVSHVQGVALTAAVIGNWTLPQP